MDWNQVRQDQDKYQADQQCKLASGGALGGAAIGKSGSLIDSTNGLEKAIDDLRMVVSNLEERLAPVLVPTPPNVQSASQHSDPSFGSPLAQFMQSRAFQIQELRNRVVLLLSRLDGM